MRRVMNWNCGWVWIGLLLTAGGRSEGSEARAVVPALEPEKLDQAAWDLIQRVDDAKLAEGWHAKVGGSAQAFVAVTNYQGRAAVSLTSLDTPHGLTLSSETAPDGRSASLDPFRRIRVRLEYTVRGDPIPLLGVWPSHSIGFVQPDPDESDPVWGGRKYLLKGKAGEWTTIEVTFVSGYGGPFRLYLSTRTPGSEHAFFISRCEVLDEGPSHISNYQVGYETPVVPKPVQWFSAERHVPLVFDSISGHSGTKMPAGWTFFSSNRAKHATLSTTNVFGADCFAMRNIGGPFFANLKCFGFPHHNDLVLEPDSVYLLTVRYATGPSTTRPALKLNYEMDSLIKEETFSMKESPEGWTQFHESFQVPRRVKSWLTFFTNSDKDGAVLYLRDFSLTAMQTAPGQ